MTITNNAFGYTEKAEISYSDVTDGSWYADTVAIAKAAGYITGYPGQYYEAGFSDHPSGSSCYHS